MKKIICLVLSFIMIMSLATSISASVNLVYGTNATYDQASVDSAVPQGYTECGRCGEDAYWGYYEDTKTLVIGGEGSVATDASSLESTFVDFPFEKAIVSEGITVLGNNVFTNCVAMKEISLPDSLVDIYNYVFTDCDSLKSFTLPKNVERLGVGIFLWSDAIEELKVDVDNAKFDSRENCNAIISTESNCLRVGIKTTTFPKSVTAIGGGAFVGTAGLTELVIPDTITQMEGRAFSECDDLKKVVFSAGLKKIPMSLFDRCDNLETVSIPYGVETIDAWAFMYCKGLKEVTIPGSVKNIYQSAFNGCISLESVTIKYGVEYIGATVFAGCSQLKSVSLPQSVNVIDPHAFADCTALEFVKIFNSQCDIKDYEKTFPKNAVIYGCEGSTAQAYAKKYKREFVVLTEKPEIEVPTTVLGDVDLDGNLSVMDATEIQLVLAQFKDWKHVYCEKIADMDHDSKASVMDATEIQLILAGLK